MDIITQSVSVLSHTPSPETLIERAGRTCYKSEDRITADSSTKFVQMICGREHDSVLEHASATLLFTVDRGVTHEMVRHRLASFSQESTRYVNYHKKGEIRVIRPLGMTALQEVTWYGACKAAETAYVAMLELGAPPEVARDVLPTCTAADIVMTANFREWRHVLRLRRSKRAHPKIREVMVRAGELLHGIAPTVFPVFAPEG